MSFIESIAERVAFEQGIPLSVARRKVVRGIIGITVFPTLAAVSYLVLTFLQPLFPNPALVHAISIMVLIIFLAVGIYFALPLFTIGGVPTDEEDFAYLIITAYASKLGSSREIISRFVSSFNTILTKVTRAFSAKPPPNIERLLTLIDVEGASPSTVEKALMRFETMLEKRALEFRNFTELINSMILGIYIVMPILSLVSYFMGSSGALQGTILFSVAMTFMIVLITVIKTPKYFPKIVPYLPGLGLTIIVSLLGLLAARIMHQAAWVGVGIAIGIGGVLGYLIRRDEAKLIDEIMESLPRVLTTLYDRIREARVINIARALGEALRTAPLSLKRLFNPYLDNVNIDFATKFRDYLPLAVVLRCLQDFSEVGVTELSYKVLADGLSKIYETYETYRSATIGIWATLCFIMPLVLSIAFSLVTYVTAKIMPTTSVSGAGIGIVITIPPMNYVMMCGVILVALSGFAGGFARYGRLAEALLWMGLSTLLFTFMSYVAVQSGLLASFLKSTVGA